jgi:hypothetical protein
MISFDPEFRRSEFHLQVAGVDHSRLAATDAI